MIYVVILSAALIGTLVAPDETYPSTDGQRATIKKYYELILADSTLMEYLGGEKCDSAAFLNQIFVKFYVGTDMTARVACALGTAAAEIYREREQSVKSQTALAAAASDKINGGGKKCGRVIQLPSHPNAPKDCPKSEGKVI